MPRARKKAPRHERHRERGRDSAGPRSLALAVSADALLLGPSWGWSEDLAGQRSDTYWLSLNGKQAAGQETGSVSECK